MINLYCKECGFEWTAKINGIKEVCPRNTCESSDIARVPPGEPDEATSMIRIHPLLAIPLNIIIVIAMVFPIFMAVYKSRWIWLLLFVGYVVIIVTVAAFRIKDVAEETDEQYDWHNKYDDLLTKLMQETFHHSDETAKPIVDAFVKRHPEILDRYSIEYLYKI